MTILKLKNEFRVSTTTTTTTTTTKTKTMLSILYAVLIYTLLVTYVYVYIITVGSLLQGISHVEEKVQESLAGLEWDLERDLTSWIITSSHRPACIPQLKVKCRLCCLIVLCTLEMKLVVTHKWVCNIRGYKCDWLTWLNFYSVI